MAKYKRLGYALSAAAMVAGSGVLAPVVTFADPVLLESCNEIENCAVVTSTTELSVALEAEKTTIIVGESFDLTDDLYPEGDFELYLNNYTITSSGYSFVPYGIMTIYGGENGKIKEISGDWAPFYIYGGLVLNSGTIDAVATAVYVTDPDVQFTMNGGKVSGGDANTVAVVVADGAKMVMNGGEVDGDTWGVSVFKDGELVMNGGIITAESEDGIGVSGNGSTSGNNEGTNAKLTLNAGTINSGDLGVYAPQIDGITTLGEGLSINAAKCGVEVRAGTLNVSGATINVNADASYEFNPNGNGSTASGVGIAVAQHTTQQAINVMVSDGVFTAPVAFAEGNPQHNPDEAIEQVALAIVGGEFNATNGDPIVASEDVEKFITGGTYNKEPEERYIADGYLSVLDFDNNKFDVIDPDELNPADEIDSFIDDETEEEIHYVAPRQVDWDEDYLEDGGDEEGHASVTVEFEGELVADRKATLSAVVVENDGLTLNEEKGGELIGAVDINMLDRDGVRIEVNDVDMTVYIDIDEDMYNQLAEYDKIEVVYFDDEGNEVERLDAKLETYEDSYENPETGEVESCVLYWIEFNTTHLSTYGVVGVNEEAEEAAATPETGTVTAAGASAMVASVMTAVIVGIMTSVVSFMYLIRRKQ